MNLKKIIFVQVFFSLCSYVYTQNNIEYNCDDNVDINFEKSEVKKQINDYYIIFEQGFNDTVEVYINKKLIVKDFFLTDTSLDLASWEIHFNIDEETVNILYIQIEDKKKCVEIFIKKGYKIIYVNFINNIEWWVTYSNKEKIYE